MRGVDLNTVRELSKPNRPSCRRSPLTPSALDHVVQGCLAKAPADRWQTAHDVKMGLQWIQGSRTEPTPAASVPPRRGVWVPWLIAAVGVFTALVTTALLRPSRTAAAQTLVRFDPILPDEMRQGDVTAGAISPDGQHFAFEATVDGRDQLVLRDLASTALVVLAGTVGGFGPFWSSDSRTIAFFTPTGQRLQLKRTPATGGPYGDRRRPMVGTQHTH